MNDLKEKLLTEFNGKVFSSNDAYQTLYVFLKDDVQKAILELVIEGKVTHLLDDIFVIPVYSKLIDEYSYPPMIEFVEAVARNKDIRLVPTGALAENYLGISEQVPNVYTFATDGPNMTLEYFGSKAFISHDDRVDKEMSVEFNALVLMDGEAKINI